MFSRDNILVLDGNLLNSQPAEQVIKTEKFLGIDLDVNRDSFLFHVERGIICLRGPDGLPCCSGGNKGRSIGIEIPPEVEKELCEFFRPFDKHMVDTLKLDWPAWGAPCP